jgi:hypothetical protein
MLKKTSKISLPKTKALLNKRPSRPRRAKIETLIPVIQNEINKRRNKWTLSSLSFEDVSQIVLIRVVKKYHKFTPGKSEFTHWVNKVITNTIRNVLRDNYLKYSRPCILGCIHNTGNEMCSLTKSGKQCAECPLYRDWARLKREQFNINQPVSLDNHIAEIENEKCGFFDLIGATNKLNVEMQKRLRPADFQVYKSIYIDKTHDDIRQDTIKSYGISYQAFAKLRKLFLETARRIIEEESIA